MTLQQRRALVLYGSETGNAQDVAEELGKMVQRLRFDTEVAELDAISLKQLLQYSVVLVAISTTGQGDLPANSQALWKALRSTRLRPGCLQQLRFASFGLGDSSYPKFNWAHRKLYNRLVQLGAHPICDRGESDDQHPEGIDASLLPWTAFLRIRLLEEYPLPEAVEPIPDHVLLDPKWLLDFATEVKQSPVDVESSLTPSACSNGNIQETPDDLLDVPKGLTAKIASNERVTSPAHWQDVRHLTLHISGHNPYVPGDVLTIYPKNFPVDVNEFLAVMGWSSIADRPLNFVPSTPSTPPSSRLPIPHVNSTTTLTLRILLSNHLDIMSIPRRSFFAQLAHFTTDEFQRDRLLEFTNPEYVDELYDYTTRPRRSILEVLQEFETVKIPWQRVCSVIPTLRGRQFSIASANVSPTSGLPADKTSIELLIAIVKYRTVIKKIRQGVCTRYIASLKPGQEITVSLSKGGLGVTRKEMDKPVVMIGPGTGVAPMRSLIHQRNHWRKEMQSMNQVRDLLFFGSRNAEADFFFKDEWDQFKTDGVPLDVYAAFSRDQRQKVYVQDLVRQQSRNVYNALGEQAGIVYICGSSGKMPQAVREALIEVFQKETSMPREDAEAYLVGMEKSGRYKQETW
ncbi:riboflavin synthase domain-like protein [Periconia macrospinosa]|uniref:NADPH-dependent diflavin oxidoreductase 1 n=1 Tax=Periconia macrospinosa TaxID=97972 RepID=A0A2V1E7M4_9PLEO|nr:riboflavin synthase domain-like protein [Periconia macrospinosa]